MACGYVHACVCVCVTINIAVPDAFEESYRRPRHSKSGAKEHQKENHESAYSVSTEINFPPAKNIKEENNNNKKKAFSEAPLRMLRSTRKGKVKMRCVPHWIYLHRRTPLPRR